MRKHFGAALGAALSLIFACTANAALLGDYAPATNVCGKFTTYRPSTGAAFTLAGTPALSVYKDNSTTQSTTGVTLTADFDSVTGLNHFCIDTSTDGTFYAAGSNFDIVVTTGTVDSISVVGSVVGTFTVDKVMALKPTTAGRKLDVSSTGEAGVDWANVGSPTTTVNLSGTTIATTQAVASVSGAVGSVTGAVGSVTGAVGSVTGNVGGNVTGSVGSITTGGITNASFACTGGSFLILGVTDCGTAQSATSTSVVLRSAAAFADDVPNGGTLLVNGSTQGYAQSRAATDYVGSTDTATVDAFGVTPSGTLTYYLFGTAPGSGTTLSASDVWGYVGGRTLTAATNITSTGGSIPITASRVDASVGAYQTGLSPLQPTTAGRTLDVTATGGAGIDWANVEAPTTTLNLSGTTISTGQAVASVSGAVGSVTGNVGGNVVGFVGSVNTNGISANSLATDAGTEIAAANWANATRTLSAGTNIVLAKGTGITGFNDLSSANVRTEVNGGITDNFLDQLLAQPYDVSSPPGSTESLLEQLVESAAGVGRFTTTALENAPAGGGGGGAADWTTGEKQQIRHRLGIDGSATAPTATPSLASAAGIAALPAQVATAVRDSVSEDQGNVTRGCIEAVLLAFSAGDIVTSGSTTIWKDPSNGETRITSNVTSNGNRTASITCPTY